MFKILSCSVVYRSRRMWPSWLHSLRVAIRSILLVSVWSSTVVYLLLEVGTELKWKLELYHRVNERSSGDEGRIRRIESKKREQREVRADPTSNRCLLDRNRSRPVGKTSHRKSRNACRKITFQRCDQNQQTPRVRHSNISLSVPTPARRSVSSLHTTRSETYSVETKRAPLSPDEPHSPTQNPRIHDTSIPSTEQLVRAHRFVIHDEPTHRL